MRTPTTEDFTMNVEFEKVHGGQYTVKETLVHPFSKGHVFTLLSGTNKNDTSG
jgi:hypothetical protein